MFPLKAVAKPLLKITSPPTIAKVLPGGTAKPTGIVVPSITWVILEALTIAPGVSLNLKPTGILIANNGTVCGLALLNSKPLLKTTPDALEPTNEPRTSNRAFGPNTIPFGLIKNKLLFPKTPRFPKILEGLLPVTLVKILAIPLGFSK